MKQVVSIKEMKDIEKQTFIKQNITAFDLVYKVGVQLYHRYKKQFNHDHILLIVGTGNNGGDALVLGEQAFLDGKNVLAIMIGSEKDQSQESLLMTKRYLEKDIPLTHICDISSFQSEISKFPNKSLIIDGIFGIGLTRNIVGLHKEIIEWINHQKIDVLSIDIPSGLHADTGQIMGTCVKATNTYTIEAIKQGLLLEDAMDVIGNLEVIDVGMHKIKNHKFLVDTFYNPSKRVHNTHKYDYKNVLTMGGQLGVMGAITLAGHSALVSGAGLSTIACQKAYESHMIKLYPEMMYEAIEAKEDLVNIISKKDAILFGLGMRKITDFEHMVFDYITDLEIPIVLDAMGMLLLKTKKEIHNKRVIITPHYGEFSKLMDVSVDTLKKDILKYVNQCIKIYDCEIILKGPSTIYATKDKIIYLNQGTPALAKAGSGDVLAGIILTYVAKDLDLEQGILLHMLAAKEACKHIHEESVLASDVIKYISKVYSSFTHNNG